MNASKDEIHQYCVWLNNEYYPFPENPSEGAFTGMISACTFITILIIPTILLNGLSVITIKKCPQLNEKIAYFLIMIQSLADLAVGFITLPSFSYTCFTEAFGNRDCIKHSALSMVILIPNLISLITLTIMTIERYIGILHPLKHRTLVTKKKLRVSFICGILFITVCNSSSFFENMLQYAGFLSIYLMLFLLLAIFVYTKIYLVLKNRKRPGDVSDNATPDGQNERKFLKSIKLVKSCFLAVACFYLCYSPVIVVQSLDPFVDDNDFPWLMTWGMAIGALNSSLNSVIFFWTRPLLRNEAFKVLKKTYSKRN